MKAMNIILSNKHMLELKTTSSWAKSEIGSFKTTIKKTIVVRKRNKFKFR